MAHHLVKLEAVDVREELADYRAQLLRGNVGAFRVAVLAEQVLRNKKQVRKNRQRALAGGGLAELENSRRRDLPPTF